MTKKFDRTFSIRVYKGWSDELDTLRMEIAPEDLELNQSTVLREMVRIENALWTKSPYVCLQAHHFVLVKPDGEFLYRRGETLRLNHEVQQIAGTLTMKSEKRAYFSHPRFSHDDVRQMWLLNRFSLWPGDKPVGTPLDSQTDPDGLSTKSVKLNCHLPEGAVVFREACFALTDYAQYYGATADNELYDRADILVDIPTRTLEILVVVDREIYQNTKRFGGKQFRPALRLELRNREEIPFAATDSFETIFGHEFIHHLIAQYPPEKEADDLYLESQAEIESAFMQMQFRFTSLAEDPSTLGNPAASSKLKNLTFPENYLFCRIQWNWPHTGLYFSVKWVKPETKG